MPPLKRKALVPRLAEALNIIPAQPVEVASVVDKVAPVGRVVVTSGADSILTAQAAYELLQRHKRGDWGDVSDQTRKDNDKALLTAHEGYMSIYLIDARGSAIWIITDIGRTVTTILTPDEY